MFNLIDIGANLAHDSFDDDREALLERAQAAGVRQLIVTGSDADSSRRALALARQYPGRLFSTAGLHPHHAHDWSAAHAALFEELAAAPELVALGECGLDYFRDLSPRLEQRQAFVAQIELAIRLQRPLFLHQRDAHADFVAILREHRPALRHLVVHCFTDGVDALADYVALDCYIGVTGWICDERRGRALYEAAAGIPADRLLVETDAPYLLPRSLRPAPPHRRNEPMFLPEVVRVLAQARGETPQQVAQTSSANATRFFALPPPA